MKTMPSERPGWCLTHNPLGSLWVPQPFTVFVKCAGFEFVFGYRLPFHNPHDPHVPAHL
jgi:hypothetical protein